MEQNSRESPRVPGNGSRRDLRPVLVTCVYLLAVTMGAGQVTRPESGVLRLTLWAMFASAATYWCVVDARMIGRPIVQSLHWIMFYSWPVAVPIYLIYSRKLRGLGIAIVHVIGLSIVATLGLHLAGFVKYGNLWLAQFGQ